MMLSDGYRVSVHKRESNGGSYPAEPPPPESGPYVEMAMQTTRDVIYECTDLWHYMTPAEARQLAAELVRVADLLDSKDTYL